MAKVRTASLNVNGLQVASKRRAIFHTLRRLDFDFCLLQETHSTEETAALWQAEWGGEIIYSHGSSNARGTAILVKRNSDYEINAEATDDVGRIILLKITKDKSRLVLANIYAPTQDDAAQQIKKIDFVEEVLENFQCQDIILGGDFNLILDPFLDKKEQPTTCSPSGRYRERVKALLSDLHLCDVWRLMNNTKKRFTFRRGTYASRLDYIFMSEHLFNSDTKTSIIPCSLSDHDIITLTTGPSPTTLGPGLWKFNNDLLSNDEYIQLINRTVQEASGDELDMNPNTKWEWIKHRIREESRAFSGRIKAENCRLEKDLTSRINELQVLVDEGDTVCQDEYDGLRRELRELELHRANNIMLRSKANWALHGERTSSYFLNLEKIKTKNRTLSQLVNDRGDIVDEPKQILEEQRIFFEKLYCKQDEGTDLQMLDQLQLSEDHIPKITDMDRRRLEQPFSSEEFRRALLELNKGRCPGSDGLTPEFYLRFWDILSRHLVESLLFSLRVGRMSTEQRRGVISLIPKKDTDRRFLTNWRPVTLLNTDYKILSKALSTRLQSCLPQIIHDDQKGFMKGRYIGENIRTTQDIIDHCENNGKTGFIVALDYRKAFDSVRWQLLQRALEIFNFGVFFRSCVSLLSCDIETCVMNAGFTSKYFQPKNGVRQGCCASPLLFTICVELLACMIRQNEQITGIHIRDTHFKISQFADDATCYADSSHSVEHIQRTLSLFSTYSGLFINPAKSKILPLQDQGEEQNTIAGIQLTTMVKILGVCHARRRTMDQHYEWNFLPALNKMRSVCAAWGNRMLSLKGRVTIFNSLLISLIQYLCANTITPKRVFSEVKRIACDFLWAGKNNKVAYNIIIQQVKYGGLHLMDLERRVTASRLSWIKRALMSPHGSTAQTLAHICSTEILPLLSAKRNYKEKDRVLLQHPFYHQIIGTWQRYHNFKPVEEEHIREEQMWNNTFIRTGHEVLDCANAKWMPWRRAGILTLHDICHPTEGRILGQAEINERYRLKVNFLDALTVRNCVPYEWRTKLSENFTQQITSRTTFKIADSILDIAKSSTKVWYESLLVEAQITIKRQTSWEQELPLQQDTDVDWQERYSAPYKASRETKLQSFAFKIAHRLIPCAHFLKKIRIRESEECQECKEVDTITHYLFDCMEVQQFWQRVVKWFDDFTHISLENISKAHFMFGIPKSSRNCKTVNWILLVTKFFIQRQKLFNNGKLHLIHFLAHIKEKLITEKRVCTMEGKPRKFNKWQHLFSVLS